MKSSFNRAACIIALAVMLVNGCKKSDRATYVPRGDSDAGEIPNPGTDAAVDAGAEMVEAPPSITPYAGPTEFPASRGIVTFDSEPDEGTCVVFDDGGLRCWGEQISPYPNRAPYRARVPYRFGDVVLAGKAARVSINDHVCVLTQDGRVSCWGRGSAALGYGRLDDVGIADTPAAAGFVDVGGKVVQIATGDSFTCALLDTGAVRCWGGFTGIYGELGYGDILDPIGDDETPASMGDILLGGKAKQIAATRAHACAVLEAGNVRCWGRGAATGLPDPALFNTSTPQMNGDLPIGEPVLQLDTGIDHTCVLLARGRVRCWGRNDYGQLGSGSPTDSSDSDQPLGDLRDVDVGAPVKQLALKLNTTCALLEDGRVRCWGETGSFGMPTVKQDIGDDETPAQFGRDVQLGGPAKLIGKQCALLVDGTMRCWGKNAGYAFDLGGKGTIGDDETPAEAGPLPILYEPPR